MKIIFLETKNLPILLCHKYILTLVWLKFIINKRIKNEIIVDSLYVINEEG